MLREGHEWPVGGWVSPTSEFWSCDKHCSISVHSQPAKINMWGGKTSPKSDELNLSSGDGAAVWFPADETRAQGLLPEFHPYLIFLHTQQEIQLLSQFFLSSELQLLNKMDINQRTQAYWKSTHRAGVN